MTGKINLAARALVLPLAALSLASCSAKQPRPVPAAETPVISPTPQQPRAAFDGDRAFALLKAQCDFGPRPMGTAAHAETVAFLTKQLSLVTDTAATQKWTEKIGHGPGAGHSYAMTNILGMVRGTGDSGKPISQIHPQLLLCAHYDTRPIADEDSVLANRSKPIVGADDGASGVADLLELARVLSAARPRQTVAFAFWDAEDLGEFSYGARHFARLCETPGWNRWRPKRCILLDMIGDSNLDVTQELGSMHRAPMLWQSFQSAAAEIGQSSHFNGEPVEITDDHDPLLDAGIPTIDIIDFDYPYWHTLADTPDKCSGASLKIVGDVVLQFVRDNGTSRV